jgi:hypothetical protein
MSVEFIQKYDSYFVARIHSPYGGIVDVSPDEHAEFDISHQNKARKHGFGVKITSGKQSRVLQVRSLGEATNFIREIKQRLSVPWFWKQD